MNANHIFIDTNVLIGAYSGIKKDVNAWNYLCSLKGKRLFASALSIAQLASVFQKKKKNSEIKRIINLIRHRTEIISFTDSDISKALDETNADIEDNIQYVLGLKMKCYYLITNNKRDYAKLMYIDALLPEESRNIER